MTDSSLLIHECRLSVFRIFVRWGKYRQVSNCLILIRWKTLPSKPTDSRHWIVSISNDLYHTKRELALRILHLRFWHRVFYEQYNLPRCPSGIGSPIFQRNLLLLSSGSINKPNMQKPAHVIFLSAYWLILRPEIESVHSSETSVNCYTALHPRR